MKKQTNIIIRISEELKAEFEKIANKKQMTVSEYIRYLIRKETETL